MVKKNFKNEGFTLVELLVVIAIIGLLSTLSIVALNNARMKARDAVRVANIKQIQTALELYYNDVGGYYPLASFTPTTGRISYKGTVYMGIIPSNPLPRNDNGCANSDYAYSTTTGNPATYNITYCLGGSSGGISAGSHVATPAGIANP